MKQELKIVSFSTFLGLWALLPRGSEGVHMLKNISHFLFKLAQDDFCFTRKCAHMCMHTHALKDTVLHFKIKIE